MKTINYLIILMLIGLISSRRIQKVKHINNQGLSENPKSIILEENQAFNPTLSPYSALGAINEPISQVPRPVQAPPSYLKPGAINEPISQASRPVQVPPSYLKPGAINEPISQVSRPVQTPPSYLKPGAINEPISQVSRPAN